MIFFKGKLMRRVQRLSAPLELSQYSNIFLVSQFPKIPHPGKFIATSKRICQLEHDVVTTGK